MFPTSKLPRLRSIYSIRIQFEVFFIENTLLANVYYIIKLRHSAVNAASAIIINELKIIFSGSLIKQEPSQKLGYPKYSMTA
jgi:hypothetical protein